MNSKAIKKQLLAAVAMVLVAAVALGSSTYAWFVASGTVEAYGMKVTAQSEGGLAISYDGNAWGTSASADMTTAKRLYPASTYNMTAWSHATAQAADKPAAVQNTRESITDRVLPGGTYQDNDYVLMREFKIRSTAKEKDSLSKGLYVSAVNVKVGDGAAQKTMSTALRVGVRYVDTNNAGNSKSYVYGPVTVADNDSANAATDGYFFYTGAADTTGTKVTLATVGRGEGKSDILPNTVTIPSEAANAYKVQIFVWFEGEDSNLYSDNYNVEDLNVSVQFSSMGLVSDT